MWLKPKEYKAVGDVLADLRNSAGLTQDELASRLKKPQSFVSSYEAGQRRIDVLEFIRITEVLGADPIGAFTDIVRKHTSSTSKKRR